MRYSIFIVFVFVFCFSHISYAQVEDNEVEEVEYYEPMQFEKYSIGISPSSFMNNFGGVQVSQDIGLTPDWNISIETGYIFYRLDNYPVNGFRLKPGIQYMAYSDENLGISLGLNYIYRRTNTEREYVSTNTEERFREFRNFDRFRTLSGGEVMLSIYTKLSERIRVEIAGGMGYGQLKIQDEQEIPDRFRSERIEWFFPSDGTYDFGIVTFNFNITYDLITWR